MFSKNNYSAFNTSLKIVVRQYSKIIEIPHSKGLPVVGTMLSLIGVGGAPKLHRYIDARHKQFGPIFREKIGPVSAVFISDADMMRSVFAQEGKFPVHLLPESWVLYNQLYGCSRGLFFMDGKEWQYHRKKMNKLIYNKKDTEFIKKSCDLVAKELIAKWKSNGDRIDNLETDLYRWSLDILTAVLVGIEEYAHNISKLEPLLNHLAGIIIQIFKYTSELSLMPANVAARYNLPAWKSFAVTVDDALHTANQLVEELLAGPLNKNHLLAKMVSDNMITSDVTRIVVDMVLAAGDTTAYTMQWLLFSIGNRPDLQERLLTVEKETLAKNCTKETLRMYPVAPFLTRILPTECHLGCYVIPPKELIIMSIFTSSRSSKYFDNADKYEPDRWLRSTESTMVKHASLPFAMGARSCIGRLLAEIQLSTLVMHMVESYRIELWNADDIEVILKMIAIPSKPIQINLIPR